MIDQASFLRDIPGYMERIGSGIRFMIREMEGLGLPAPEFTEHFDVVVTFRNGGKVAGRSLHHLVAKTDDGGKEAADVVLVAQAKALAVTRRYAHDGDLPMSAHRASAPV